MALCRNKLGRLILAEITQLSWRKQLPPTRFYSNNEPKPVSMAFDVFESANTNNNAAPLIIMHGLFGSKQNWRGVSRALESKLQRRIFTVDARNHGDSPHTPEHGSIEMGADVREFMRARDIGKASVMGHSMGGRTMMYFALKYPELVEHTIIVDISPISVPRDFSHMEDIFFAMKNITIPKELTLAQGRVQAHSQLKTAVGHDGTVQFITLNLKKRESGEFYWACNVDALLANLRHFGQFADNIIGLGPYKGSMLFICGNQSSFVDPDHWPQIQAIFPNAEVQWFDAGHLVHFEEPAKFVQSVVSFLQK